MTANKKTSKLIPIVFGEEDFAAVEWLKAKTKRTRAGAVKWAVGEKAEELGYKPTAKLKIAPRPEA